ncbi:MAG: arginine--tRNA ligase, partial [Elusimicrobiota bacterium]
MINPFKEAVARELASHVPIEFKEILESIEIPPRSEMGDYAFPCFKAAKILNKKPAQVAQELIGKIANLSDFSVLKNLGPYINFVLKSESLASFILNEIYKKGENFGIDNIGNGKCVVIDYSSPNIAKPFGIHHLRSTVIGNSLSKIYRALGYEVVGINHLGDWGKQFGILMASFMRWGNRDSLNKDPIGYLYDLYVRANNAIDQGDSKLNDEAAALFNALENGDAAARDLWQTFRDLSLAEFSGIYKRLDIEFQSYEGEAFYNQRITATMEKLKNSGLAVLSEGAWIVDLKSCGLGVAIIQKADGTTIYLTRDICAAEYRMEKYKFHKLLYVVGQPQELHFKQLFKILDLLGHRWASCCEHVKFGYILGMSSRKGSLVRLEEVLDEARKRALEKMKESPVGKPLDDEESVAEIIGRTAVVFNDLSSERIKDIEF